MPRLEKRYNSSGKLVWAKGQARDIYKDEEISDSRGGGYRIVGEHREYKVLLPRHCASSIIGAPFSDLEAPLPPFKEWQFVLVGHSGQRGHLTEISREISGDVVLEVDTNP